MAPARLLSGCQEVFPAHGSLLPTANVHDPKRTLPHPERQARRHGTDQQRQPVCDGGIAAARAAVLPPVLDGTTCGTMDAPVFHLTLSLKRPFVSWMWEPPPCGLMFFRDCDGTNVF